jgi:hypothetical protein
MPSFQGKIRRYDNIVAGRWTQHSAIIADAEPQRSKACPGTVPDAANEVEFAATTHRLSIRNIPAAAPVCERFAFTERLRNDVRFAVYSLQLGG